MLLTIQGKSVVRIQLFQIVGKIRKCLLIIINLHGLSGKSGEGEEIAINIHARQTVVNHSAKKSLYSRRRDSLAHTVCTCVHQFPHFFSSSSLQKVQIYPGC